MSQCFKTQINIKFHQADPAGIMYFAHIFTLAHDIFEQFIVHCGFNWNEWFLTGPTAMPIRQTECDYLRPFKAGECYDVEVSVTDFSSSTIKVQYEFFKNQNKHAVVKMVHIGLDSHTFQKINLPEAIRQKFQPYFNEDTHGSK